MNQQDRQDWERYAQSAGARNGAALPTYGISTNNYYEGHMLRNTEHGHSTPVHKAHRGSATQDTTGSSNIHDDDKSFLLSEVLGLIPTASTSMLVEIRNWLKNDRSLHPTLESSDDPQRMSMYSTDSQVQSHHTSSNAHACYNQQAGIANQDLLPGAQHIWMRTVQPDKITASSLFDTSGLDLGHIPPHSESMSWETTVVDTVPQPNRYSDASSAYRIGDSTGSSRSSLQPHDLGRNSQASAASLASSLLYPTIFDNGRGSVQSFRSYNSTSTEPSVHSKHSSTASNKSQRPTLMSTMSSGDGGGHRRATSSGSSSTRHSSSSRQVRHHCTEPDCNVTFGRESDRERHIETQHDNVLYKCLLHTCTSRCPKNCKDPQHTCGVPRARREKVRKHLEDVHGEKMVSSQVPESWIWSYIRQRAGWSCSSCGIFLGNWIENSDVIAGHPKVCTEGLSNLVRRLSVEKAGGEGHQKRTTNEPNNGSAPSAAVDTDADKDDSTTLW